jgi:hypothetical protein
MIAADVTKRVTQCNHPPWVSPPRISTLDQFQSKSEEIGGT